MKEYDNNIELFDAYLNNSMSANDRQAFETRLAQDAAFRQEFTAHKEMVYLLQKSCSDADREFEQAMKGLSDDEFRKIVSEKKSQKTSTSEEKPRGRMVPLKTVYRWMSAAAVVLLFVGIGGNMVMNSKLDNMKIAYCNQIDHDFSPDGLPGESRGEDDLEAEEFGEALIEVSDGDYEKGISKLENLYKNASTSERKVIIGTELAFAYITKAKDLDAAKCITNELKKINNGKLPDELEDIAKDLK